MAMESMRTSRVVGLALVVGAFFVTQEVLTDLAGGKPVRVANDVGVVLLFWVAWAFLTPAALKAVHRWPLDAKPVSRTLLAHVVVGLVLAFTQSLITIALRAIVLDLRTGIGLRQALERATLPALVWSVFTGLVFYSTIVIACAALRFRRLYAAERVSAAALEAELTRSKLETLRSQLRPHFLFNTLNAISVFVAEDTEKAQQMILRLSTLLRRSLDEEAHEVPLREELAFVNDYLDIQRGRFGDGLCVRIDVDRAAVPACVPVFLLQPLFENAIEHGTSHDRRLMLELSAHREQDMLRITLADNGPGVGDLAVREGIGLSNTRVRLQHLYGARATVDLGAASANHDSPGTRVEIRLPFREAPV
jgi:two-component system LytT family sensor kinase